jgi:protein-S-isoprenylcysteine O-methyltransferase Ste14
MYLAAAVFLFGEAAASSRGILFAYAAAVTACYHPAVIFIEEPALRRRFGDDFDRYCAQVPRWLPRVSQRSGTRQ